MQAGAKFAVETPKLSRSPISLGPISVRLVRPQYIRREIEDRHESSADKSDRPGRTEAHAKTPLKGLEETRQWIAVDQQRLPQRKEIGRDRVVLSPAHVASITARTSCSTQMAMIQATSSRATQI